MPPRDADDSGRFDGRVALVTGAARGMGRATALRLAREGASVVACDLGERSTSVSSVRYRLATTADLEETGRLVRAAGSTCLTYEVDVRERVGLEQAVAKATATLGRLDILAACAGIQTYATLLELDDAIWEQTLAVNLTGVANSIRAVMRQMIEQRYGRIIVVGSIGGRRGTGTPN
jgi:NAD(P)-dependent dehydrogenase (short-subunit alcohol dehydrogenase family)